MGKVYDGIMGLVVADALGVPFEFKKRDTFKATDMTGYGTYNMPIGTWSDDSSLTLATLDSMGRLGRIDLKDIMGNFVYWLANGAFTPYGEVFDVGGTTRKAIAKYNYQGRNPKTCGCGEITDNGNGSLMRILPLAFVEHSINDVHRVSALTHAHDISKSACVFYLLVCDCLLDGMEKHKAVKFTSFVDLPKEFERIKRLDQLTRDEIKSTGYVVDTLEAALWCFIHTHSYKECVLTAVNLGNDTDTVAAVAGGLAGIYYGVGGTKGIPYEWIEQIARKKWIWDLCNDFERQFSGNKFM